MRILSARQRSRNGRATLKKAGLALFSRKGFEDTSVEEICLAAGYSKGGFYFHFRGKVDLLAEILDGDLDITSRGMDPFVAELWAAAARSGSLRRRLFGRESAAGQFLGTSDSNVESLAEVLLTLKTGLQVQQCFSAGLSEAASFVDSALKALVDARKEEPARLAS